MINLEELKQAIRHDFNVSNPRMSPLYKLLRDELTAVDHWKGKRRGNPQKGYATMKANIKRD